MKLSALTTVALLAGPIAALAAAPVPAAVQAQPSDQDHAWDRVAALRKAGAREIVVDKALRREPTEQALDHPVLQVQMNDVFVHRTRVLKDHGSDR